MKNKKLFKYIPITIMTTGVVLTAFVTPHFLNNSGTPATQTFNDNQQVNDADYTDQLSYIRSDVAKQDGVTNSVKLIELANTKFSTANSTAAIVTKMDGSTLLYTWGRNDYGQLGLDNKYETITPTQVTFSNGKKIIQIAIGGQYSAALLEDGSLYTWGRNNYGQLGLDDITDRPTPTQVTFFNGKKITQIAIGDDHSAALSEDGSLYTWGYNYFGQLGLDDITDRPTPTQVTFFNGKKISQIAFGSDHSAALLENGTLYTWGYNEDGELGLGDEIKRSNPTQVLFFNGKKITQIAFGQYHSAVLLEDGILYTWGSNYNGQLGLSDLDRMAERLNPTLVAFFNGKKITQIAIGDDHSAALLEDGSLYTWGENSYGRLGLGNTGGIVPTPTQVSSFGSSPITQIAFGGNHSAALLEDGTLYTWGSNYDSQLGLGNIANTVLTPTWMPYLGKDSHITANDTITPKQAVDSFWVNDIFDPEGFKTSFKLINIPYVAGQEITMDTKPTYDITAGTVTIKVKFKYFYDENGLPVADTSTDTMTISGFKTYYIKTKITALSEYPHSVVIDKWMQAVTVDNKLNYNKLEKYLDLSTVPTTADFEIKNENIGFKTGVLTFDISTTQVIDSNNVIIDTPSDPFPITLKLTERITKMTIKASTSSLTAAELKAKLFNEDGLVKDPIELENYMSVVAPVDGVKYYLIAGSWDSNPADGTLTFTIYADKYYNNEGKEQPGSVANVDSQLPFNLSLQPEASSIDIRLDMPDVRVDQFEASVKNNGIVVRSELEKFLTLTNVPNDANFTITDVKIDEYDANFERNHLKFKLTIDKFNQGAPATPQPYSKDFELTLKTQHAPTQISVLDPSVYPADYTPSEFQAKITSNAVAVNGNTYTLSEANLLFLAKFLVFSNVPPSTVYQLTINQVDDVTGTFSFNLFVNQYYDANGELVTEVNQPYNNLVLQLGVAVPDEEKKPPATTNLIDKKQSAPSVDAVWNLIKDSTGNLVFSQLSKYVGGLNSIPTDASVVVNENPLVNEGEAKFEISCGAYYDGSSLTMIPGEKTFIFTVMIDYIPTPVESNTFPWWWILVGIGGAVIIGLIIWLVIKKNRQLKK